MKRGCLVMVVGLRSGLGIGVCSMSSGWLGLVHVVSIHDNIRIRKIININIHVMYYTIYIYVNLLIIFYYIIFFVNKSEDKYG